METHILADQDIAVVDWGQLETSFQLTPVALENGAERALVRLGELDGLVDGYLVSASCAQAAVMGVFSRS